MPTTRYGAYTASIVTSGPTTTNFTQIVGHNAASGSNKERTIPGGALDPGAAVLNNSDSMVTMTLEDLVTLFSIVSISAGVSCTGGATFRHQQRASGGTFTGSTNNVTVTSSAGCAYVTRITAQQDSPAQAEVTYRPFWDGSTEPLVRNTGVSFTQTPAFVSLFYLGPVYVNSVLIEGIQSVSVDTGVNFSLVRANGEAHARVGSIVARLPTITFTTLDQNSTVLETIFNDGLAGTIAVYLRKGTDGGSRVADATASHCKISATAGSWNAENISVSGTADGTTTITVHPTTTLAAVTNSAIP